VAVGGSGYSTPGVVRSTDGGTTWQDEVVGLPSTLIYDLAYDPEGNLYVVENGATRISVFNGQGALLRRFGGPGSGPGQMIYVSDLAVDGAGHVYVGDQGNHRIQKFSTAGTWLAQWGSYGLDDGHFDQPAIVDVGPDGHVYVADGTARIQRFTADGVFLASWGGHGAGPGQFEAIGGLAVDPSGNVFASDIGANRVHKFGPDPTPARRGSWGGIKRAWR